MDINLVLTKHLRYELFILASIIINSLAYAYGGTIIPLTIKDLVTDSARIFRGYCVSAEMEMVEIAGAQIEATRYIFRTSEHLKGQQKGTVTFRQVGTSEKGINDLGRLVGLPVYEPGAEYVLFLLPESWADLTSPVGIAQGALLVRDEKIRVRSNVLAAQASSRRQDINGLHERGMQIISYEQLRRRVLKEVKEVGK